MILSWFLVSATQSWLKNNGFIEKMNHISRQGQLHSTITGNPQRWGLEKGGERENSIYYNPSFCTICVTNRGVVLDFFFPRSVF